METVVALAGNPNVGKSTVFNALTGLRQHTGNWSGKTVANARGYCQYKGREYALVDLPGCYSLTARSADEETARDFIRHENPDAVIVVCDAACLEHNLILALQIMKITPMVIVCVNLMDEAKKKQIEVDTGLLSARLGVPVVATAARSGQGLDELMDAVGDLPLLPPTPFRIEHPERAENIVRAAEALCRDAVRYKNKLYDQTDRKLDRLLAGRLTAFPAMLLLLTAVFWITLTGANYPSRLLSSGLFWIGTRLEAFFYWLGAPDFLSDMLVSGVYRVVAWVISVMLPPMAIFFPLFALLEDSGYLPRIAFNLDRVYKKCRACGKQALTMCMGFGCNAVGVTGCRIIDSPRERLIAIITNNFVPCNGRFPTIIAIISMFFIGSAAGILKSALSALLLTGVIVLGVATTFIVSRLLSSTILKGEASSFILELPPYRRPQIGRVIVRSLLDRALFVLARAAAVAAPAGLLLWLLANISAGDRSLLSHCSDFLDPFAELFGMDGVILLAFILGLPANEIVIPIIIMAYTANGSLLELDSLSELRALLSGNGWTWVTAACVTIFSLMHWPCSTTCLTIKKETGSLKWTAVSFLVPTSAGLLLCFVFASCARLFGV